MKRAQQLRELETAEAEFAARCLALRQAAGARIDDLRQVHPGWLIAAGAGSGVLVHQLAGALSRRGVNSSLLFTAFRLGRLIPGNVLTTLTRPDA